MKPIVLQNGQLTEADVSLEAVDEWSFLPVTGFSTASSSGYASVGTIELNLTSGAVEGYAAGGVRTSWTRGTSGNSVDFADAPRIRLILRVSNVAVNSTVRALLGRTSYATTTALAAKGYGFEVRTGRLWLVAHNGTALTEHDTGVNLTNYTAYAIAFGISSGTLYLQINGDRYSTTGAPTSGVTEYAYLQLSQVNSQATFTTSTWAAVHYSNGKAEGLTSSPSGAAAWGGITGTLSAQTDLANALNAKWNTPSNAAVLNLLGDSDGTLTYNGEGIGSGGGLPPNPVNGQMIVADDTVAGGARWTGVPVLPAPNTGAGVLVSNGQAWYALSGSVPGSVLVLNQAGIPVFATVAGITYDPNSGQPQ